MSEHERVLIATFGSAGDLFPLIPVAEHLRADGHDVAFAVPRALGLYLRSLGLPAYAVGRGAELRVFDDPAIVTTRFGGWASWRKTAVDYVAPQLADDVTAVRRAVAAWRPTVVATSGFAAAARVAAHLAGIRTVELSIYPQHTQGLAGARGFGQALRATVAELTATTLDDPTVTRLAWGVGGRRVLLHDPALAGDLGPDAVGFPYWDAAPSRPDDQARVDAWLATPGPPTVLVTLGSFLGAAQQQIWHDAAKAGEELGVRMLLVGPLSASAGLAAAGQARTLAVGFVPLSTVMPRVDLAVHHGGIGTTFAALRAGRPAVVVPQAFDQPGNAALVERAGVGLDGSRRPLVAAIEAVLANGSIATRALAVAGALVPEREAAQRGAARVVDGGWGRC